LATGVDIVRGGRCASREAAVAAPSLNRLRLVVLYVLQRRVMPPSEIGAWLKARSLELGPDPREGARRPLDAIREDDLPAVLTAVNAVIRPAGPLAHGGAVWPAGSHDGRASVGCGDVCAVAS
jgi:hypothetical protein